MGGRGASSRTSAAGGVIEVPKMPARRSGTTDAQRKAYRAKRDAVSRELDRLADEAAASAASMSLDEAAALASESGMAIDRESLAPMDGRSVGVLVSTTADLMRKYPLVRNEYERSGGTFLLTGKAQKGNDADSFGGINLGAAFTDYRSATRSYMDSASRGIMVNGDGTARSIVRHEFGHELHSALMLSMPSSSYREMTSAAVSLAKSRGSEYARTDKYEAFAEGFAEYESNPRSAYGRAFGKLLKKYL